MSLKCIPKQEISKMHLSDIVTKMIKFSTPVIVAHSLSSINIKNKNVNCHKGKTTGASWRCSIVRSLPSQVTHLTEVRLG